MSLNTNLNTTVSSSSQPITVEVEATTNPEELSAAELSEIAKIILYARSYQELQEDWPGLIYKWSNGVKLSEDELGAFKKYLTSLGKIYNVNVSSCKSISDLCNVLLEIGIDPI